MIKLSIIVTAYQAENTIRRAIESALNTSRKNEIEIVVVDDCSKDKTCEVVRSIQEYNSNVSLYVMPQNTGGPSKPRNYGVKQAKGEFVTFLDDDDEFNVDRLLSMVDIMLKENRDFGKGYLICKEGEKTYEANRLPKIPTEKKEMISSIITYQSMTQDFIVKRSLLIDNKLEYRSDLKIGEDTLFVLSILCVCNNPIYIDDYFLTYYKTPVNMTNLSSTQNWSDKEIISQLTSWQEAEKIVSKLSLSYYKLRLPAGLRNMLVSIVRYSNGISEETYKKLHLFTKETKRYTDNAMNLSVRYEPLYKAILSGNYEEFKAISKKRLLIAGYDLKFVLPIIPYLEDEYNIKVDEWTGHHTHDEKQSQELLSWADVIWCEWLLGNAQYYAEHKNKNQCLVIRAHRFELWREFGFNIDFNKVDMIFFVGYYYYEQFIKKFNIPRQKARLLSNYCETSIYNYSSKWENRFNLSIVGILPRRKGFMRGLTLLKELKAEDERFKLYIMGNKPEEVRWIASSPVENEYYKECELYIKENKLEDSVIFTGFLKREELYNDIGYVLSLSDKEAPESFHMAPAEGSCAGCAGLLLKWPGVEYIYPKEYIFEDLEDIKNHILELSNDKSLFENKATKLRDYVNENYNMDLFISRVKEYLHQARIMR